MNRSSTLWMNKSYDFQSIYIKICCCSVQLICTLCRSTWHKLVMSIHIQYVIGIKWRFNRLILSSDIMSRNKLGWRRRGLLSVNLVHLGQWSRGTWHDITVSYYTCRYVRSVINLDCTNPRSAAEKSQVSWSAECEFQFFPRMLTLYYIPGLCFIHIYKVCFILW